MNQNDNENIGIMGNLALITAIIGIGYGGFLFHKSIEDKNIKDKSNENAFNSQGEGLYLARSYEHRAQTIYTYDLIIPKSLYACYLQDNILKPAEVAKACGKTLKREEIKSETTLGTYILITDFLTKNLIEIKAKDLPELKALIEARMVTPHTISDLKKSWVKKALEEKSQPQSLNR
jgi:hypothetical protein